MRKYTYMVSVYLEPECPVEIKRLFLSHDFSILLIHRLTSNLTKIEQAEDPVEFDPKTYYYCIYNSENPCDNQIRQFVIDDQNYVIHAEFSKILSDK